MALKFNFDYPETGKIRIEYNPPIEVVLPCGDSCDPVEWVDVYDECVIMFNGYFDYMCTRKEWDDSKREPSNDR